MKQEARAISDNIRALWEQANDLRCKARAHGHVPDLDRHVDILCCILDAAARLSLDIHSESLSADLMAPAEPRPTDRESRATRG
jgi:hypothetical protein